MSVCSAYAHTCAQVVCTVYRRKREDSKNMFTARDQCNARLDISQYTERDGHRSSLLYDGSLSRARGVY